MASEMMSVARLRRRNSQSPPIARTIPSARFVRSRLIARYMKTEASNEGCRESPSSAASFALIASISVFTASRAARKFAPFSRVIWMPIAGFPF